MRAISESLTTVIIFSTILVVAIIVFVTAFTLLNMTTQTAEYGYVKTIFINLANNLPDLLEGGTYAASLPTQTIGLGYQNLTSAKFTIVVAGETIYSESPVAIYARSLNPIVTANKTAFGSDSVAVGETILLGRVEEAYHGGSSYVKFDTMRAHVKVYLYRTEAVTRYVVNILYVRLEPLVISSDPSRVAVSLASVRNIVRLIDVSRVPHQNVVEIGLTGRPPYVLSRSYFTESNNVLVNVRVVTLRVVYL